MQVKATAMLPDGVREMGPRDARLLAGLRTAFLREFALWGYEEVVAPTFELSERLPNRASSGPISSRTATYSSEILYRLFDRKGRVLVLRPDITEPVARMASAQTHSVFPLRFSYFGNAFRQRPEGSGQAHEIWQAGLELIGVQGPSADAEALAAGLAAVRRAGINDVKACIGYPAIAGSLTAADGRLPPVSIPDLLAGMDGWFGPAGSNHTAHLKALASLLIEQGDADSFVFDISLAREMTYYSGPVFEFYSARAASPVAGGGRYDGLCSNFGRDLPATGLAIDVLQVMAVLRKENEGVCERLEGTLIGYEEGAAEIAGRLAASLRKAGRIAEVDALASDPAGLLKSAQAKRRETALFVTRQGYQEFAVAGAPDESGRRSTVPAVAGVH